MITYETDRPQHNANEDMKMNVIEQLADFESQLNYVSKVLQYSMLSVWEKKEYLDLKFEYSKKITQLKKYIKANNLKF